MTLNCQFKKNDSNTFLGKIPSVPIDPVEYGRGQLSAMAHLSVNAAREVHILRLRNSFERAGIVPKLRYSLWALDLMREAQELNGGYWFPTPLRVVTLKEKVILIGSAPTHELQRHFLGVTRAGYARVLDRENSKGLPTQELDDWLGFHWRDSVAWSESQITNARASMSPTILSGNVEFFDIDSVRFPFGNGRRPVWRADSSSSSAVWRGVVFCRERVAPERYRYFFGQVKRGSLAVEAPAPKDVARIQFGFAALVGRPITSFFESNDDSYIIHIPATLPRPELQLTLALGVRDKSCRGKAYRVDSDEFFSFILEKLKQLGCDVRSGNA